MDASVKLNAAEEFINSELSIDELDVAIGGWFSSMDTESKAYPIGAWLLPFGLVGAGLMTYGALK